MKCSKCKKLLFQSLKIGMKDVLTKEIQDHVAGCPNCRRELDEFQSSIGLIDTVKTIERIPMPSDNFENLVMSRIFENKKAKPSMERLVYGIAAALFVVVLGILLLWYKQTAEKLYIAELNDLKTVSGVKNRPPVNTTDPKIQKPQPIPAQNKSHKTPRRKLPPTKEDMEISYDLKAHIEMELVEVLNETIKAIKRGDQEWEIEI